MRDFINTHFGTQIRYAAFKVVFYDGGEKLYKNGAAAYKFCCKCIREDKFVELLGLDMDTCEWVHIAAC